MRLSLVGLFLLQTIAWFIAWLFVWYQLGSLVTLPANLLAKGVVAVLFPDWAEGVQQTESTLALLTTLPVPGMEHVPEGRIAVFSPEVDFLKYGYGLPLLIALLFASDARRLFTKVAIESGAAPFSPMAREAIAFGYQFGYLVLPALVPVLLWAAMDKRFLATFMVEATLEAPDTMRMITRQASDRPENRG